MPISFSSVDEAVELLDARQNTSTTWLARCPSCDRDRRLAISANPDQTVALCCQDACTDSAVDRAVNAIRNRTRAITVTGTVTPSAGPSGVGIGDPVLVSVAETATGTVPLPNGMVGVADPTPVSGAQSASGPFLEHPQATANADPTSIQLTGDQTGLPADTVLSDSEQRYQWLSPLGDADYFALRESIETFGVMVPVVVDEDGVIIDGYHRVKACLELGIDWPRTVLTGLSEVEKWDRARDLNDARRHLTARQRKALLVRLNERLQGESLRVRAGKLGMSKDAVRRMDSKAASGVSFETPDPGLFRTGADGKRYPARRPRQGTVSGPVMDSARTSFPEAVVVPPSGQEDADQDSGVSCETPEIIAGMPDRDVKPPAVLRLALFNTEKQATAPTSVPTGRKRGKARGEVNGVPTDPDDLAEWLFELLGLAGSKAVAKCLHDICASESKRVVPNPGQMAFA